MAETSAPAIVDYLARLDDAARRLPPELRTELVGQVREHLADLEASGLDEAGTRTALERFGTPEALVAAEAEQAGLVLPPSTAVTTTTAPAAHRPWGGLELTAVLLVLVGGVVVPVVAPLVGMLLAWLSPRWTRWTKTGASLLLIAPLLALGVGTAVALQPAQRTVAVQTSDGVVQVPIPDQVPGESGPSSGDGFWESTYPVLPHTAAPPWLTLVAVGTVSVIGWLGAGLWLALAGRGPRRAT